MLEISLTSFIDFVLSKDSVSRLNTIKKIKLQMSEPYHPSKDYYKPLREVIILKTGEKITTLELSELCLKYPKRKDNFIKVVKGYNTCLGKQTYKHAKVKKQFWVYEGLTVRVNPEVALQCGDTTTYYKLYFKNPKACKRDVEIIYHMLHSILEIDAYEDVCIMGLQQGKRLEKLNRTSQNDLSSLLEAEANYFVTLYNTVR